MCSYILSSVVGLRACVQAHIEESQRKAQRECAERRPFEAALPPGLEGAVAFTES
jgi:hypothetical protein